MSDTQKPSTLVQEEAPEVQWIGGVYRPDLAHPKLTEEMIERLRDYGEEEPFDEGVVLYTHGDRDVDMFVVLGTC